MSDQELEQAQDAENNQDQQVSPKKNSWIKKLAEQKVESPEDKQKKINEAFLKQLGVKHSTGSDEKNTVTPLKMKITQVVAENDDVKENDDTNDQEVYSLEDASNSQINLLQEAFLRIAQKMKGHFTVPLESIQEFNEFFKIGNTEVTVKSFEVNDDTENDEETTKTPASYEAKASIEINGIEAFLQSTMIKEVSGTYDTQAYEQQAKALTHRTLKAGYGEEKYNKAVPQENAPQNMESNDNINNVIQSAIMHGVIAFTPEHLNAFKDKSLNTEYYNIVLQGLSTLDDVANRNRIWNNGTSGISALKESFNTILKLKSSLNTSDESNEQNPINLNIKQTWFKFAHDAIELLTHSDLGKKSVLFSKSTSTDSKTEGDSADNEKEINQDTIKSLLISLVVSAHAQLGIKDSLFQNRSNTQKDADEIMKITLKSAVARHFTLANSYFFADTIDIATLIKAIGFVSHFEVKNEIAASMLDFSKHFKQYTSKGKGEGSIVSNDGNQNNETINIPRQTSLRERWKKSFKMKSVNNNNEMKSLADVEATAQSIKHDTDNNPLVNQEGSDTPQSDTTQLTNKIKQLESALQQANQKASDLEQKNSTVNEEVTAKDAVITGLKAKLEEAKDESTALIKEHNELKNIHEDKNSNPSASGMFSGASDSEVKSNESQSETKDTIDDMDTNIDAAKP